MPGAFARVHQVTKFFTRLEVRHALSRNLNRRPRLRVASRPGLTLPRAEASKSPHLNLVVGLQSSDNGIKKCIDDHLAITAGEVSKVGHAIDEFGFRHSVIAPVFQSAR